MWATDKLNNCEISSEIGKEVENEKRLCGLFGFCGKEITGKNSHMVSHFGLKTLNEQKN